MSEDTSNTTRETYKNILNKYTGKQFSVRNISTTPASTPAPTPTPTPQELSGKIRVWIGGLDKNMDRDEIHIQLTKKCNKEFHNPSGTNCIQVLNVPPANESHSEYKIGHKNQGHCDVYFKHKKYAEFFIDENTVELHPIEYKDAITGKMTQSRAASRWVDIEKSDPIKNKNSKPVCNIHLKQLQNQPSPRVAPPKPSITNFLKNPSAQKSRSKKRTGMKAFVPEPRSNDQSPTINADPVVQQDIQFNNTVQPSGAEVLEISTNGFNEQSSDDSGSQLGEVFVEVQTNANPQLTRSQEGAQEEGGPGGGPSTTFFKT